MRALNALLLLTLLAGCMPVATVSLSGPARVQEGRRGVCRVPIGNITFDLPDGLIFNVRAKINDSIGGQGYRVSTYLEEADRKSPRGTRHAYLLSFRAVLSTEPGYAPIEEMHGVGDGYSKKAGQPETLVSYKGKPLRETDLGVNGWVDYIIPDFIGASTEMTLPPMMVDGKRIEIPTVTLHKSLSYVGFCAH